VITVPAYFNDAQRPGDQVPAPGGGFRGAHPQ